MNPYPYQIDAIAKSVSLLTQSPTRSLYNGSDPGTGKTIMTIKTCEALKFSRILVVCPAIMRLTWKEEFKKWYKDSSKLKIQVIESLSDAHSFKEDAHVTIVSYQLLGGKREKDTVNSQGNTVKGQKVSNPILKKIDKISPQVIILDEAHYLKDSKSERSKVILKMLWKNIPYRIALSGTPFLTSVTDAYAVFSRMAPDVFPTFDVFGQMFSNARFTNWGWEYKGVKNTDLLSKLIRDRFFIRCKKEDVLKELPKRILTPVHIPSNYSVKEYEKFLHENIKSINGEFVADLKKLQELPDHISPILKLQGEVKIKPITEFVSNLLDQNIPVVIFANNRSVIDGYMQSLFKYKPVKIDGSVSPSDRQTAIHNFQTKKTTNLMILNTRTAGVGITLTRCCHVVFGQIDYSPAVMEQAICRFERIGQQSSVNIFWFIVKKSMDEVISSMVLRKGKEFMEILNK